MLKMCHFPLQVQLPFDKFLGAHLRFGFRHLAKFEGKSLL